ncbi:glutaredoxin family protein [Desulfonatronospira sp.]|uniref:glutaredoxin family protein n=1 Tax=Desulfonatronospira sp. TaxID=1962951 RepID=UPI0025C0C765|nr:glutaredoxin family protein [Desulfonatronospira sp.]
MSQEVKIFALSTCIHCKKAKEYLDQCGVKYTPVHVDWLTGEERNNTLAELKKYNPAASFPTILVGDRVIVGFRKDELDQALGIA